MKKDDLTWLRVCYAIFAIIIGYTSSKLFNTLGIETGWSERYDDWYPFVSSLASILCGILTIVWILRKKENKEYHLAAVSELRKVSWPTFLDTRKMTIVVCVVVGVFSAILALFDMAWSNLLGLVLS